MITPNALQIEAINNMEKNKRGIIVMPTGTQNIEETIRNVLNDKLLRGEDEP